MNTFSTPSGNLITTKNFNFSSSYILVLAIFLCCFFQVTKVNAQCSYGGTAYCTVDASTLAFQQGPTQTPVSVTGTGCTCFYGGEYMPLTNVKAGEAFTIYTNSAAYDNQLTIFFEGDGTALAYQDDGGPWTQGVNRASISFVAPYSGDYRILNNVYNCTTNVTCLDIRVAKIWPWGGGFGGATPPCSASFTSTNVGSGTYSYLNLTAGSNYTISTCGSSFNTQLTLYNYDGTNWRPFAYNGKNGSDCNGVNTGSVTFEAPTTSGANNYIAVVNRQTNESLNQNAYTAYNNYNPADQKWDDHDWSGVSAVLKYRNNGVTTLTATSSGNVCSGATNGSVSLSLSGSCASNTLIAGQFERFNTSNTALNGYGGRWTYSGAGTAQTDGSGQAYFLNGNQNSWTNGFWANNTVTRSEGLTFYGRWYNTGTYSMVGWHDNTNGTSYTNLTYALYPYNSGGLAIYENGLYRGDVTSKAAGIIGLNKWVEFKIVLHNSGASYYVRNNLNGAAGSWTLVYYSTYSNAATLKAGAAHYYSGSAYFYMDDLFVGGMTQYPATSSLGAGTYDYMAQDGFGNVGLASATIGTFSTANNPGVISLTASTICTGGASTVNNVTAATTGSPASTGPLYNYYYMLNGGPTGTGGTWVGSGQSAATSWVVPSAVTTTVGSHTIARNSAFSCVSEVSAPFLNLVVVADPSAPTATASPNVATVCAGQTLTLTGVTDNGGGTGTCNIEYSANGGAYSTTLPSFSATVGTRTIAIRKNCNGSGCDLSSVNTYTWSVVADPILNTQPGNASFCPGGTYSPSITASGGTPSLDYVWKYSTDNSSFNNCVNGTPVGSIYSNTTSSNTFSVAGITAAGTYYYRCFVSATGSNCDATQSNSGVLTVYPYPTFTTTPSNILCNGGTSGSILVNVTVGTSLFDYSKNAGGTYAGSSNQSSPYTFTGLTAGSYDIVVRDAHNCVSLPVSTITLSEPSSLPTLTETHTAVLCNGGSTGTITVTASGGTAGYNYSKDGGTNYQVSNVFSGLAQGTYQIKVRDANLCTTANTNVSITQPAVLSFTSTKTDVVCFGDNNGTITLNGTGGVAPYQYSDDNGSSYNAGTDPYTFSSLAPTTYLVGIRDANLCPTTFVSKTIDEPALLSFTTSQVDILCNGDNTGSITVSVTGGTGTLVYSKNGGSSYQSSNIFSGLIAGTYSIKVKDANLCITAAQSVTINEPASLPTLTETHTAVLCNGGSTGTITVTASGGTAGYNYSKDGGTNYQVSNVFSGLAQGTYQIKVRDANLCTTANTSVSITQPAVLSFTSSKTDVVCFGDNNGTITLNGSGGVAPYQYSDDNGSNYSAGTDPYTFTSLTPTTYLVGITDANSCPTTFVSVTIDEPAVLSFTTSQVDVLCNGNNTGSITVSATGGTTIYRYSKNNGVTYQLSNVFSNLTAGTYDIVVKDANNCITASQQVIVTEPTGVTFTTSQVHVLCNGDNTGSITVNANGGTPGYEYSNDNGTNYQISNVFSTLLADVYPVKVRDANGCTTSASNVSITEPTLLTYTTSFTNVNCNGVGDGTITINGSGGVQPYTFSINNGSNFQFGPDPFTFNNLPAATYLAGIKDDNGCVKGFTSITIIQPTAVTFTTSQVNVLCFGGNNASITVSASGGVGGYTYSKDNGTTYQLSNIFTSLYAGNYQIKVKDAGGCITSASSITITQPGSGLTVTASNGSPYSTTVTANLYSTPGGGTPGYTYNWSGPASFATNPAHLLQNPTRTPTTVNMTGTYKVTVTDANGCSASAQTVMNVYDGYVWIGTTSTDWNNNNNWSFQVPDYPDDCTQKAYIQAGTLFSPTVNIPGLTVGAITLVNGAVLNLDHDLTLCSNLVGSTTTIVSNVTGTGKLIMKSSPSVAQTISGKTKFNTTLQIDNSAGVSITAGATQIVNALELKSGVLNVVTANLLVFLSNSSSHTAIIDNFSAGMNGSINGAVTMQRRYDAPTSPSYKTEHYMGSPIDQPLYTAFGANGTEGRVINTLCDEKKASSNSPVGNMARFDENWPDAAVCNLQGWYIVKTGNTENGRGYSVARTGAGLLTLTGNANQASSYTRTSLTNSGWSNMTIQGHRDTSGWHILSNPWLANLSLSASGGAGIDNQVAVWQTTGPYAGGYRYYQVGFEPVNIAPFQAFLVHKTAVGGIASYTINGSDRVRTPTSVYFHSMNNDQELAVNVDNTNGLRDRTVVAFNTQATDNFDAVYDGNKLWGDPDRVSLYSENHNMPMARNTLTSISNNAVIPMGFDAGLPGSFTMSFEGLNSFDATSYIMLEDKQTHAWHNVRNGNYIFNGDTTDNLNRFVLHFTPASVINHTDATCNTLGIIHAEQPGTANWNYTVENNNAVVVSNGSLNAANPINLNVPVGVYTLTLVDNHNYTVLKQIQVSGLQGVQSSYVASANVVEQNADVTFTSTAVNATGNTWNFGDNNIANGVTVMHSYTAPGVYSSTLTSNNTDCSNTSTQQITVTEKATTGINSVIDKSGITIWSNDNTVYVDFAKHPKVEAQIEIYNVLGQQLSNDKFNQSSVFHRAFTNLEAAYVIVRVKNNDEIITKKVFIATK